MQQNLMDFLQVNNFDLTVDNFNTRWTERTFKSKMTKNRIIDMLSELVNDYKVMERT